MDKIISALLNSFAFLDPALYQNLALGLSDGTGGVRSISARESSAFFSGNHSLFHLNCNIRSREYFTPPTQN